MSDVTMLQIYWRTFEQLNIWQIVAVFAVLAYRYDQIRGCEIAFWREWMHPDGNFEMTHDRRADVNVSTKKGPRNFGSRRNIAFRARTKIRRNEGNDILSSVPDVSIYRIQLHLRRDALQCARQRCACHSQRCDTTGINLNLRSW